MRKKHPKFTYKGFEIKHAANTLKIGFDFRIDPDIFFRPEISIKNVTREQVNRLGADALQNFAFHCGLAEIPTYWKIACSPEIIIEAGYLDKQQIRWWKDLFIRGMGQFFYENKIDFRRSDFLTIRSMGLNTRFPIFAGKMKERYLVPVAGGRDSIVGVELLKRRHKEFNALAVNPTKEAKAVVRIASAQNPIIVYRKIDPALFQLNKRGYLNGHTPFTSVLSFLAAFCAALFDFKYVAFSNEKSANEGNLKYLGREINHQYSKSLEFEKKFRVYLKKYLASGINYFSLLRFYLDLEISKMFCRYPKYFSSFSSCNRGKIIGKKWCGECPKCLFVYATLYPFLEKRQLLKIFGQDLFEKGELSPMMRDLIDPRRPKPFECVGTKRESRKAFLLSLSGAKKAGRVPRLLKRINPI